MSVKPRETTLEFKPSARFDVIDVRKRLTDSDGRVVTEFPRALYASHHTTAGFVDPRIAERLGHDLESIRSLFHSFQELFPPDAGYRHDQMDLREELSEEERTEEPFNADSHLTFIGAGLRNCVSYANGASRPVWFIELDGLSSRHQRHRRTTVIGYSEEIEVVRVILEIPVSGHGIESVNLKSPSVGFFDQLEELLARYGIAKGRVDIALAPEEEHAGLTVNEYETLLMKHDLAAVLRNPLYYMAKGGKQVITNPRAVPRKTLSYARYDGVQLYNRVMDILGVKEASVVERILNQVVALPASRFLGMKDQISIPVSDRESSGRGIILEGTYQSPILVQWKRSPEGVRRVEATLVRFE